MTPMQRRGLFALVPLAAGTLAAPRVLRAQAPRTLADTIAADSRFNRFSDLITRVSAWDIFRQPEPNTVFAPVDQAFLGAPQGLLQDLLGSSTSGTNIGDVERDRVLALVKYHIVPGNISAQLGGDRRIASMNGDLLISGTEPNVTIRNPAPAQQVGTFGAAGAQMAASPAQVVGGAVMASNGVIYPVSQILWP